MIKPFNYIDFLIINDLYLFFISNFIGLFLTFIYHEWNKRKCGSKSGLYYLNIIKYFVLNVIVCYLIIVGFTLIRLTTILDTPLGAGEWLRLDGNRNFYVYDRYLDHKTFLKCEVNDSMEHINKCIKDINNILIEYERNKEISRFKSWYSNYLDSKNEKPLMEKTLLLSGTRSNLDNFIKEMDKKANENNIRIQYK